MHIYVLKRISSLLLFYFLLVYYASLGVSSFYYFLTLTFQKIFTQNIYNIDTISTYRSNSV